MRVELKQPQRRDDACYAEGVVVGRLHLPGVGIEVTPFHDEHPVSPLHHHEPLKHQHPAQRGRHVPLRLLPHPPDLDDACSDNTCAFATIRDDLVVEATTV